MGAVRLAWGERMGRAGKKLEKGPEARRGEAGRGGKGGRRGVARAWVSGGSPEADGSRMEMILNDF